MLISKYFTLEQLTISSVAKKKKLSNVPSEPSIENLSRLAKTILDPAHEHFGTGVIIRSGFRAPRVNESVGGALNSQHCVGEAVDFEVNGVPNVVLANWVIEKCMYDQCILEFYNPQEGPNSGWVHASVRGFGNRRQQFIAYKNGSGTKYFPVEKF